MHLYNRPFIGLLYTNVYLDFLLFVFIWFWDTPSSAQGLLSTLYSGSFQDAFGRLSGVLE